ncbi:GNAT family N-acetyltransferase [Falsibacillus albus]|uniref:N-acetyltransferase n=1 Tax=Falsibacillus albus TaxID=2478915 RepID=A0A3L7K130_9BACI|nr:GNAT family N-acetyltransferase [Falsibacillus albus]RLQ96778.1 N-acetyltransferase [Falsibacillus albus]
MFTIRKLTPQDVDLVYEFSTEAQTRKMSLNQNSIPYASHLVWYGSFLKSANVGLIVEEHDIPIAFFRVASDGEVSITLNKDYRSKGLSHLIVNQSIHTSREFFTPELYIAFIRPENTPSIKCFTKAGFKQNGEQIVRGVKCLRFEKTFYDADGEVSE